MKERPTAEQWEDMKLVIEDLYLDKGWTLAEVRTYMSKHHDVRASERMYKTKIKKWQLNKNAKDSMYVHLQRIYDKRTVHGKETVFEITRGKKKVTLNYDDIKKHNAHVKGKSREQLSDSQLEELNAYHEIVVITPSNSPKLASPPRPAKTKNSGESIQRRYITSRIGAFTGSDIIRRGLEADEELALKWANEYINACSSWGDKTSEEHRLAGKEYFQTMILSANRYIIPGLSWMTTILGSLRTDPKNVDCRKFLVDCCQAFGNYDKRVPYGVLYHYWLGSLDEEDAAINHFGSLLEDSGAQIRLLWGQDSPSMLVCNYCLEWHRLRTLQAATADAIYKRLLEHLATSERLMGHHNLMTINFLVLVSRFLQKTNNLHASYERYDDAITRFNEISSQGNLFRLQLSTN